MYFRMNTQLKTPQTCCKLSILPACLNLSIFTCALEVVNKLQQTCQLYQVVKNLFNRDCKLSFSDLLELVETTCSKPVGNKF